MEVDAIKGARADSDIARDQRELDEKKKRKIAPPSEAANANAAAAANSGAAEKSHRKQHISSSSSSSSNSTNSSGTGVLVSQMTKVEPPNNNRNQTMESTTNDDETNNTTTTMKRQQLASEKDKLKQRILDALTELYFLQNDGLMCDFHLWASKEQHTSHIANTTDEDLASESKFSQLLNLKFITTTSSVDVQATPAPTPFPSSVEPHHSTTSSTSLEQPQQTATPAATSSSSSVQVQPTTKQTSSIKQEPTATTPTRAVGEPEPSKAPETSSQGPEPQRRTSSITIQLEPTPNATSSPSTSTAPATHIPQATHTTTTKQQEPKPQEHVPPTPLSSTDHDSIISPPPEKRICREISRDEPGGEATQQSHHSAPIAKTTTTTTTTPSATITLNDTTVSTPNQATLSTPSKETDSRLMNESVESNFSQHVVDKSDRNDCNQLTSTPAKVEPPTPISKVVDPIVSNSAASLENHNKQLFERAKHEALVTARIAELRKLGLWSAKRLPKLQEPPRPKTHWDYVLEEMRWLSADFDAERKWKRKAAKKCALMVYRYHQDIRSKTERAKREHLQHLKRIAASNAREVRSFWMSIEKIVDFRQQTKLEETRKKAWGQHLNYILDQTSKFSNNCPENTPVVATNDIKVETKDMEIDYLISQDDENAEKDAVIKKQKMDDQAKSKHEVDDIAAGAESIQPKGNTLETTTVSTKIPFLLKHNLREYQHIGLDWLVAMYNKKLNGILADEMGLGKTIQTIALLAHLACEKNDWGPHLIVVPTSVMLNWEMEFKKWCPGFKILTYYGNPKERRMKRVGWSLPNSFHVCITSYRIVIQDHAAFRRKKWCYFILDEAHYIKNFKSQRWQMLLNFNSQRRLLLTGTPLQNDLMELWSLMHFLMPNLFDSYREFKDWFVNPLTGMIEGSHEYNQELVHRLHKILRPFLLRRLKADVEKQLPRKREFIKSCKLSKRQRYLYEEFMSLSKTKETLASGNFLSVINILMQLRKVCNHPNLFEPRPTISPFMMSSIVYKIPGILSTPLDYNPEKDVNLSNLQLTLALASQSLTSYAHEFIRKNFVPRKKLVLELDDDIEDESKSNVTEDVELVDEGLEAIKSSKIIEAHNKFKLAQRAQKESRLCFVSTLNEERSTRVNPPYFSEIQDHLFFNRLKQSVKSSSSSNPFSNGNGRIICSHVDVLRNDPNVRPEFLTKLVDEAVKTPVERAESMRDIIERFVFCVPGVSAQPIGLHASHYSPAKKSQELILQQTLYEDLSPRFDFLSKIMVNMRTSFPELRLIEYDCGKLQTLGRLLNELKSQDHRVLIFTQMSRMLDILEQFLNYHGHTYLRLDGATKIDQRQILMERFNNDRKIFCFILSTRSGGIGVNLTGADTVIFYDSDWNPTMDAQAQDRCHRIGQTRDVHIYRLISEDTIEKNIFMKAQQKRMLGDLAIEEGNFNTSCFKRHAIQELFNLEPSNAPVEVDGVVEVNGKSSELSKTELIKLEQALSKGEAEAGEDVDVDAIKIARADVDTDLREFDENIPLTEANSPVEKSEKEQQIDTLVSQMTKVEQYAVRFLESLQKPKNKEEIEQAEKEYQQELENKKSQWEQSRMEMLKEQSVQNDQPNETLLTYPKDAKCQHVQYLLDGERKVEEMPLWAPPTPPTSPPSPVEDNNQYHYQPAMTPAMAARINAMGGLDSIFGFGSSSNKKDDRHFIDEKDLYHDYTVHFLYEPNIMVESQLPPVNQQYTESEMTSYTIGSKKIRLTGTSVLPSGYFPSISQLPHLQQHLQNSSSIPSTPDGSSSAVGQSSTRKPKVRRDEVICLPKSIFDRQTPNFAKIRRELKLQKLRCVTKGNDSDPFAMQKFFHSFSLNPLGQSLQQETIVNSVNRQMQQFNNPAILLAYHQTQLPPWTIQEEWALLMVIQHLQDLPVNLCILTPGHTPNWELVSEVITDIGFTQRSFKMCEYHFALNVQKREMTRDSNWDERAMQSNPSLDGSQQQVVKKQKKMKTNQMLSTTDAHQQQQVAAASNIAAAANSTSTTSKGVAAPTTPFKPSKTGSMLVHDKSLQISFGERYDIIKRIRQSRPKPMRARYSSRERPASQPTNLLRDDKKIIVYDRPLKPETLVMELIEERKRRAIARGVFSCCNPRDRSVCYTGVPQNGTQPTSCKHK